MDGLIDRLIEGKEPEGLRHELRPQSGLKVQLSARVPDAV
jgi:hypothetical protein